MTTTPRTASTSDARERKAERLPEVTADQMRVAEQMISDDAVFARPPADQPPVLPDTSGWVKRAPGDVIEAGTPYVGYMLDGFQVIQLQHHAGRLVNPGERIWTPPPVPREPWRVISTDRDQPTDAYVNGVPGRYWLEGANVHVLDANGDDCWVCTSEAVTDVELLHTHSPVTQVPVERALIDEAARLVEWWNTDSFDSPPRSGDRTAAEILTELAALADGAQS